MVNTQAVMSAAGRVPRRTATRSGTSATHASHWSRAGGKARPYSTPEAEAASSDSSSDTTQRSPDPATVRFARLSSVPLLALSPSDGAC